MRWATDNDQLGSLLKQTAYNTTPDIAELSVAKLKNQKRLRNG